MVKCSRCNSENDDGAKFCHNCGAELKDSISSSSNSNSLDSKTSKLKKSTYYDSAKASPNSHKAYYDHSASSGSAQSSHSRKNSASNSNAGFIDGLATKVESMSLFRKLMVGCCAVFIVLLIGSLIFNVFVGFNVDKYTEDKDSEVDYSYIDLDGDGALSLEELSLEYPNIPSSSLEYIFELADSNGNGLIVNHEFDNFDRLVDQYWYEQGRIHSSNSDDSSSNSSSSSSSSSGSSSGDYVDGGETCPYCGSEAIYQSGGVYKCGECGRTISNPDDLDLNYDEGYYLVMPVSFVYSG